MNKKALIESMKKYLEDENIDVDDIELEDELNKLKRHPEKSTTLFLDLFDVAKKHLVNCSDVEVSTFLLTYATQDATLRRLKRYEYQNIEFGKSGSLRKLTDYWFLNSTEIDFVIDVLTEAFNIV